MLLLLSISVVLLDLILIIAGSIRYALRAFPEYESRLIKYSRRGFYIVDEKLVWNQVSRKYLDLAKQRLLERNVVRGRAGVTGLRLLLAGVQFKEVQEKVDIFQLPKVFIC